jgi:hypothetical protein
MHRYSDNAPFTLGAVFKVVDVQALPTPTGLGTPIQVSYNEMTSNETNGYIASSSSNSIDGEGKKWSAEDDGSYTYTPAYAWGAFMDIPEQRILDGKNCLGCLFSCYDYEPWICQQIPQAKVVNKYSFYLPDRWRDDREHTTANWTFEASNDGSQWTILHQVRKTPWTYADGKYESPVFLNDIAYNRYRLRFSVPNNYYWWGVALFKFYTVPYEGTKPPYAACKKYSSELQTFHDSISTILIKDVIPNIHNCYDKTFTTYIDLAGRDPGLILRFMYGPGFTSNMTGLLPRNSNVYMGAASWEPDLKGPFKGTASIKVTNSTYWRLPDTAQCMQKLKGDFTIEFWAYPTVSDGTRGVVQFDEDTDYRVIVSAIDNRWVFWASSNGSTWDILQGDSRYSADTPIDSNNARGIQQITYNTWQHVACVHHGEYWYTFVNGVLTMIRRRTGTWCYQKSDGMRIYQAHGNNSAQYYGGLYDLRVYSYAKYTLTEDEQVISSQGKKFFTPETEPAI